MDDIEGLNSLQELFGDNLAEWSPADFSALYVSPPYQSKLTRRKPAVLVGGRGSGKSTALQALRHDKALSNLELLGSDFGELGYLGIYIKINKNQVRAFQGTGFSEQMWQKLFSHYFNILACIELVKLTTWLQPRIDQRINATAIAEISRQLGENSISDLGGLQEFLKKSTAELLLFVNSPTKKECPALSVAEHPIRVFSEQLERAELLGDRTIFCCIDEYENLLPAQQAVLNTYLKHSEPPLSYKVGVRRNGFKTFSTIDEQDPLSEPDDYQRIEIAEEGFDYFSERVADYRLAHAVKRGAGVPSKLRALLPNLSLSEEALELGADRVSKSIISSLAEHEKYQNHFRSMPASESYFLAFWAENSGRPVPELAEDWIRNPEKWKNRINNYGYVSLFWLSKGRKGARIRKYYCGSRTFIAMASGNIRYFLDLISFSVSMHYELHSELPAGGVDPKAQTLAARDVGRRRLDQLERFSKRGVELKRLVLGIGKVFFELTRNPIGTAPEASSFVLSGTAHDTAKVRTLLNEGVAHLAFESFPRTKATSDTEIRDDEYRLHPIFAAFFEYSYRRKRRITLKSSDILGILGDKPSTAIANMLQDNDGVGEDGMPDQLALFSAFFND